VTRADVLRVAQRVLREEAMHLAVIGPYDDAEGKELKKLLTFS
jgi:hypothetical protein